MHEDIEYIELDALRNKLCKLAKSGKLDSLAERHEDVALFKRVRKANGDKCPYLIGWCRALKAIRPEIYKELIELNG